MFILKTRHILKLVNIKNLREWISFETRISGKCCKFICLYRSPGQTNDEFESSLKIFELTLNKIHEENLFMMYVLGDFDTNSNNCCKNDTTSHQGSMIDVAVSNYGLRQLIQ